MVENMMLGFSFSFSEDGTYHVDATIDNDGRWELRKAGKQLVLLNNLREDRETYELILQDGKLEWFLLDENSIIYRHLETE